MKKAIAICSLILFIGSKLMAQLPNPALIGYWHNWNDASAPYIPLDSIDTRYNVVEIAFAVPVSTTNMTMQFIPDGVSQSVFIAKVQALQLQGKKVLISVGGATASIDLTTTANKNAFVSSMTSIINTYGFDGLDIDIENGNSILISGGTISAPGNIAQINLIDAIKQIMANYRATHPQKLLLTMAPETAFVQGGQSGFGSIWGGYLPIIHALRDSLDLLQVQLYNSGSMYGIDSKIYTQGSADFVLAMTEAVIQGFNTSGGMFTGLPASKIAVGLPACTNAAGGGFVDSATVKVALNYLTGKGPKPGTYVLSATGGYPTLRGLMTWSINWDAVNNCANRYQFANNYQSIFGSYIIAQVPNYVSTTGLVVWWPFTGNAKDSSGYGLHGTVSDASLTTDRFGQANKAYQFNGTTSKITGPNSLHLNLLHNRTVSVWMKSNGNMSDAAIVGYLSNGHNGYQVLVSSSGKIASMEDNWIGGANNPPSNGWDYASSNDSNYLSDNIWHHVVSVRSNDTTRIYIDGVLQNYILTTLVPNFASSSLVVGSNNTSQYFKGAIDEIGIWNRALTPLEISKLNYGCPHTITTQPTNQFGQIGANKNFTLIHSGLNRNYQWQTNPLGCGWQNLFNINQYAGVQTNVLTVSGISYSNHQQAFRLISRDGECTDTSNIVLLNITNIANDSLRLIQLQNDSIAKASIISSLMSDTAQKASIISQLISDTTSKANLISYLVSDTSSKASIISYLIADTTHKGRTIVFLISDTLQKGNVISYLISDTTSKGIKISMLERDLANKHDTVYVASIISNDTLKISIHTGLPTTSSTINSLIVYPNPASTILNIDLENPGYFIATLTGLSGQTVISQKSTTIDISSLPNGLYVLSIVDSENKLISTNKVAIIR